MKKYAVDPRFCWNCIYAKHNKFNMFIGCEFRKCAFSPPWNHRCYIPDECPKKALHLMTVNQEASCDYCKRMQEHRKKTDENNPNISNM